jgi:hypothetical protein
VGKFVASLDRRLAEQINTQAMASTFETRGAYSLEEAYDAALVVSAGNAGLKIARELVPRAAKAARPRWGGRPSGAHAALQLTKPLYTAALAAPGVQGGPARATIAVRQGTTFARTPSPHGTAQAVVLGGPGEVVVEVEAGGLARCVGTTATRRPSARSAPRQLPNLSRRQQRSLERREED